MPKFYFHLSNCDERFPDNIGYDLPDVAAAHTRAKRLANLVMATCRLASHPFDWRRWTVTVTNDSQGAILIMPFGAFGSAARAALSRSLLFLAPCGSGHKWAINNVCLCAK